MKMPWFPCFPWSNWWSKIMKKNYIDSTWSLCSWTYAVESFRDTRKQQIIYVCHFVGDVKLLLAYGDTKFTLHQLCKKKKEEEDCFSIMKRAPTPHIQLSDDFIRLLDFIVCNRCDFRTLKLIMSLPRHF